MTRKELTAEHLFKSACGYGMAEGYESQRRYNSKGELAEVGEECTVEGGRLAFQKCIDSIPDEYFEHFIYTLYRIADKSGSDGFNI